MEKDEKWIQYSASIQSALSQLFNEESEFYMGKIEELDLTQFFHALANAVPTNMFNNLTGKDKTCLEFNHLANSLVFQYSIIKKND